MGKYSGTTDNKFLKLPNNTLGIYNAWDTYNTARLVAPLFEELKASKQEEEYLRQTARLQSAVVSMSTRGMLVNNKAKAQLKRKFRKELSECDSYIIAESKARGVELTNPNSPKQAVPFLFGPRESGALGLKPVKFGAKGGASVDQESLTRILRSLRKMDEHAVPILHAFFHRSRLKTIEQRYLNKLEDVEGVVRSRVKMAKTKTTRFAYDNPPLQQYPPEIREIFVARPGHVFLSVDYSQLEARLQAYFADDKASIAVFEAGGDVHKANSADLFNKPPSEVTEAERNYGKGFLYKITYGGEGSEKEKHFCPCERWGCGAKLPQVLSLTRAKKLEAESRWFTRHAAVRRFQNKLLEQVRFNGYYEHPLGGRRYFSNPYSRELEREIKNEPMQRGAAKVMGMAQIALHEEYNAPIVLQMHDEFLFEVPEDKLTEWKEIAVEVMERPISTATHTFTLPVDVAWGHNWGKVSDTNEGGMREWELT